MCETTETTAMATDKPENRTANHDCSPADFEREMRYNETIDDDVPVYVCTECGAVTRSALEVNYDYCDDHQFEKTDERDAKDVVGVIELHTCTTEYCHARKWKHTEPQQTLAGFTGGGAA